MSVSGGTAPPFLMSLPLYTRERASGTHWTGGYVGPRARLDDVERRRIFPLPELELRILGRPARSQSLYRLSYLGLRTLSTISFK
jgi:hypothetical protein